jgi:hypothetical protein
MTKIVVQPNASGTGTFTIAAPNSSNTQTLTLPDVTGTLLTSTGDGSSLTGVGKVLQVVQGTTTTPVATTSATPVDTGLSLSITPTSASSKILVLVSQYARATGRADPGLGLTLVRDSTAILTWADSNTALYINVNDFRLAHSMVYLDSPATTSSTTYKTQIGSYGSGTITAQHSNIPSTITLMEIAG